MRLGARRRLTPPSLVALLVSLELASAPNFARAEDALQSAAQALAEGRYEDAEHDYAALVSGAQRAAAMLGLGRVQLETGRYEDAEHSAQAALDAHAALDEAETLRAEALSAVGKLDAAQKAFERAARVKSAFRAQALLGRLLIERGRPKEAEPHLLRLIEAYNDDALGSDAAALCYVAMAARALGSVHDANDAFRESAESDHGRVETQLEWASLFLDKYDQKHAQESVEEALEHNPNSPEAHVLMARLLLSRAIDFPAAQKHLDQALAVNPRLPSAFVARAAFALRDMDIAAADAALDAALAIDPNDLEALSVRVAGRFLADDAQGAARAKAAVLSRNPRFSRMYSIVADYAEWEHRYDELVQMAREALRLDPEDAMAYATLGLNLLRAGDERAGLDALREAWKRDRFNVQVFNTLNLYEKVIAPKYESFDAPPFELRLHKSERAALEPYLVPMLRKAYEDMRTRYRFTPDGPLHVELYANAQHFSVRTTGLPNVGVQGVCFGRVVTGISPRGGPFNWGQITWHELAHVFHLQLSKNHVPRWFTEGLAEYETIVARPEWRREEDYELWAALQKDRVPKLSEMNKAFTQARTPADLMTAYYVASQVVVYVVQRFGFDKVRPMLTAWGEGKRTDEVFAKVLGVDESTLDADFRAYTKERLHKYDSQFFIDFSHYEELEPLQAAARSKPDDPDAQAALALGLVTAGSYAEGERAAKRAIERVPNHPIAHFALTRVALEKRDGLAAERSLQAIVDGGHDGYILRVLLARAAMARKDYGGARKQAERAIELDADKLEAFRILYELAQKQHDGELELRALRALAGLDQHDRVLHLGLLLALHRQRLFPELVSAGERALYVDPAMPRIHGLLAEAYLETGKPESSLFEIERALSLSPKQPGRLQLLRARAFLSLGRSDDARKATAAAVQADPSLAAEAERIVPAGKP